MESMRGVYIGGTWEDFRSLHIMHLAFVWQARNNTSTMGRGYDNTKYTGDSPM